MIANRPERSDRLELFTKDSRQAVPFGPMTMTNPKTKKLMTDKAKYLTVYTKQADGSWKVVADTYISDSPM